MSFDKIQIIENIREQSSTEAGLKTLKTSLSKEDSYKSSPYIEDALSALDPSLHSLGYTYLLYVLFYMSKEHLSS